MDFIKVKWIFSRPSVMPILEAQAQCETEHSKMLLIPDVLDTIKEAESFGGKLLPQQPGIPVTTPVAVSFTLIFPSESDINKYINYLRELHPQ